MSVSELPKTNAYDALADELDITRAAAKTIHYALAYRMKSFVANPGVGFNILRCHEIAAMPVRIESAENARKWAWLTQDQPYDTHVAYHVIRKFLPTARDIVPMHALDTALQMRNRLTQAAKMVGQQGIGPGSLADIERELRPLAYILTQQGQTLYPA